MFYTVNTRLLGVIVSLSLSLITLIGFLIYLLIVTRANHPANSTIVTLAHHHPYHHHPHHHHLPASNLHNDNPSSPSSDSLNYLTSNHHNQLSSSSPSSSLFSSSTNFLTSLTSTPLYDEVDSPRVSMCTSVCPEKSYKDFLCDVKFVMLVNVTSLIETYEDIINGTVTRVYSIVIKKTFKKSLLFIIAFRTQRITVTTLRACPRDPLSPGHLYFITGRVKGLTALIDHCDLTIDWTTINDPVKEEIRSFFSSIIGSCNTYATP